MDDVDYYESNGRRTAPRPGARCRRPPMAASPALYLQFLTPTFHPVTTAISENAVYESRQHYQS